MSRGDVEGERVRPESMVGGAPSLAFEELTSAYAGLIRGVVRRHCGDLSELHAEDAEQEVRLALWRFLESGRTIAHPYSFLLKTATRIAARIVRRAGRGRHDAGVGETAGAARPARTRDPGDAVEIRRSVHRGLARLSRKRRAAVRAYLAGMNHEEIARVFAWTPAAARHAIYDGLDQLRAYLREQGIEVANFGP